MGNSSNDVLIHWIVSYAAAASIKHSTYLNRTFCLINAQFSWLSEHFLSFSSRTRLSYGANFNPIMPKLQSCSHSRYTHAWICNLPCVDCLRILQVTRYNISSVVSIVATIDIINVNLLMLWYIILVVKTLKTDLSLEWTDFRKIH